MAGLAVAGVGLMVVCSSSLAAVMLMGGEEETPDTGAGAGVGAGAGPALDPNRVCPRKVTAKRTDTTGGWGMNLKFKCGDETVIIGPGGANEVESGVVTLAADACPTEINKTNWLGTDTYGDTFATTVSDCLDPGETCQRKVTVKRTDTTGGWGMNLKFKCDDEEVTIGPGGANEVTSPTSVNINELSCPGIVSRSNWLGTDTYGDTFKVTVGDCE